MFHPFQLSVFGFPTFISDFPLFQVIRSFLFDFRKILSNFSDLLLLQMSSSSSSSSFSSSSSSSSSLSLSAASVECHRFFAISKRVPKDVKRFCGICRQHGKLEETRGHVCEFKNCECPKCNLVRSRRLVMSQQIRLRRAQDKRFQRTTEPEEADVVPLLSSAPSTDESPQSEEKKAKDGTTEEQQQQLMMEARNMCYFCQKCKNHGILVWKKHHKRQCPFTDCTCDFCELIETRRRLDQHIKRRKSAPQDKILEEMDDGGDDDEGEPPRKKSTASLPAQIEAMSYSDNENANVPEGNENDRIAALKGRTSLDLLGTQLSQIQQKSGESTVADREQQQISLIDSSQHNSPNLMANSPQLGPQLVSSSPGSCSPSAPSSLDSLQLLSRSLLSASSCVPFGSTLVSNDLLAHPSASLFLPPMLSADAIPSHQNGLLADSSVLAQLLLLQATNRTAAAIAPPVAFLPENDGQQKAFLLQIISKMMQEQQQNDQQQVMLLRQYVQQSQNDGMVENAVATLLNGNFCDNLHSLLHQQTDQSLGSALLLQQQQNRTNPPGTAFCSDSVPSSSLLPLPLSAFRAVQQQQQSGFQQML